MAKFFTPADDKIKVTEDVSYLLNNALHVNCVFTASGAVASGSPVLRVNLPDIGDHAEVNWYNTSSDYAATAAATVKDTVSSADGFHNITVQLSAATAASQEYHIEGWIKLP